VDPPARPGVLQIVEQNLPGEPPEPEEEAERRGLPDLVLHDSAAWCVLIESKVQAGLTEDQLQRHRRTLRRRGFESITTLVLTKSAAEQPDAISRTWSSLYEWLGTRTHRAGHWPSRLRSYLRAAELRLAGEAYLTEGTLTMFDGFQFSAENPYTYREGKRLLKLVMQELRRESSIKRLGIDPKAPGRSAITGSGQSGVWDFIPLRDRPRDGLFTAYPHLTLSLDADPDSAARHGQRQRSQRRRVFTPKMRSSSMCIGAILLTGYLGGATATQVRVVPVPGRDWCSGLGHALPARRCRSAPHPFDQQLEGDKACA
jgi:hypothetical protein